MHVPQYSKVTDASRGTLDICRICMHERGIIVIVGSSEGTAALGFLLVNHEARQLICGKQVGYLDIALLWNL